MIVFAYSLFIVNYFLWWGIIFRDVGKLNSSLDLMHVAGMILASVIVIYTIPLLKLDMCYDVCRDNFGHRYIITHPK